MATTPYGTPMVSSVMPNPTSAVTQLMGTNSPMANTANMGLPFSSNLPIDVNENTSNLEEIQNFPVVGRTPNGIHFHQDPITGQMYRMTEILHQRIPMILSSKKISPIELKNYTLENTSGLPSAKPMPIISINGKPIQTNLGNFNTNLNSVYSGYDIFQPEPVKNYSIDLVSNKKFTDINVVSKIQIGQIEQTNLNNQLVSNVAEPTQKITKISTLVNPNVQNITTDILVKPQKITKLSDFSNKNIESTSVRVFNLERKLTKIKSFI